MSVDVSNIQESILKEMQDQIPSIVENASMELLADLETYFNYEKSIMDYDVDHAELDTHALNLAIKDHFHLEIQKIPTENGMDITAKIVSDGSIEMTPAIEEKIAMLLDNTAGRHAYRY